MNQISIRLIHISSNHIGSIEHWIEYAMRIYPYIIWIYPYSNVSSLNSIVAHVSRYVSDRPLKERCTPLEESHSPAILWSAVICNRIMILVIGNRWSGPKMLIGESLVLICNMYVCNYGDTYCVTIIDRIVLYAILTLQVTQNSPQRPVPPPAVTYWKPKVN